MNVRHISYNPCSLHLILCQYTFLVLFWFYALHKKRALTEGACRNTNWMKDKSVICAFEFCLYHEITTDSLRPVCVMINVKHIIQEFWRFIGILLWPLGGYLSKLRITYKAVSAHSFSNPRHCPAYRDINYVRYPNFITY